MHAVRGFTLFEVAVSLALVAVGVVSVLLLFPVGIRAQQMSRFQLYAAAKAVQLIDEFNTYPTDSEAVETEAPNPWDVAAGRGNQSFDLEQRLATPRFSIMPLPPAIARRLDSEGDEIARLIDEGGCVYYSQPRPLAGSTQTFVPDSPPSEAQRLVFGVIGYAQENALTIFPWKSWPYYMPYPSPPAHGSHEAEQGFSLPAGKQPLPGLGSVRANAEFLWEDTSDPDVAPVLHSDPLANQRYGYLDHLMNGDRASAIRYCQAALWYCAKKGLPPTFYDRTAELTAFTGDGQPWEEVQALRFLSHATTCLTTYCTQAELLAGVSIDPVALDTTTQASQPLMVTEAKIVALHDSCLRLAMLFAASFPYDWAVPRPLQRTLMTDHPLLEYDLYSPPLSGTIWGTPANVGPVAAQQWRPLAPQAIQHIGRSFQWMNVDIPSADPAWSWGGGSFWGNPAHVTLTRRFAPDERCRQLVFWAVDWQAYEDCETAPSAPVDAGRYPRGAPMQGRDLVAMLSYPRFWEPQLFAFRNPEKVVAFTQDMTGVPSGTDISGLVVGSGNADQGGGPDNFRCFSGVHGADRNANGKLDHGPLPKSQRLRAATVARFDFYDPRVPETLR